MNLPKLDPLLSTYSCHPVADLRGAQGTRAPLWAKISSFSCRFWGKNGQIVCWCPPTGVGAPCLWNPGSATAWWGVGGMGRALSQLLILSPNLTDNPRFSFVVGRGQEVGERGIGCCPNFWCRVQICLKPTFPISKGKQLGVVWLCKPSFEILLWTTKFWQQFSPLIWSVHHDQFFSFAGQQKCGSTW